MPRHKTWHWISWRCAHDGETCGHYSNNDINGEYLKQITGTDFDFYQGVKNKFVKNG